MIKSIKLLTVLTTLLMLFSFTYKSSNEFIGTYGVSESNPSKIKLTINVDHTFYYQDFSIPDKKIMVKGIWTIKGKKVILKDNNSEIKFHNVWTFKENGKVAKSRKELAFYTLRKIDS